MHEPTFLSRQIFVNGALTVMLVLSGVVTSEMKEAILHGRGVLVAVDCAVAVIRVLVGSGVTVDAPSGVAVNCRDAALAVTVCATCVKSKFSPPDWEAGRLHAKVNRIRTGIRINTGVLCFILFSLMCSVANPRL